MPGMVHITTQLGHWHILPSNQKDREKLILLIHI